MSDRPLDALDDATRLLVRAAAAIAGLGESGVRDALLATRPDLVPDAWVEELLLQSHLFSGFPRALNAAREWRLLVPLATAAARARVDAGTWRARGEEACAAVYGRSYTRLRQGVAAIHPELDDWMVVDGYGKVLGRPGLDLARRELCIVAACAISGQDRQLLSHLHGAVNVGLSAAVVRDAVDALGDLLGEERTREVRLLLAGVANR